MTLDSFLVYGYPRLVQALLLVWLAFFVLARRDLKAALAPLFGRREAWALAVIAAAGAALRLSLAPRVHQVLWDEIENLNLAHNFFRHGAFAETVAEVLPDLSVLAAAGHWPPVFHVLLSAVFTIAGYDETRAFALNLALGALAVPIFALAVGLLWESAAAGLAAGVLLAADPLHLKYSGSGDLTACSVFWLSAALLAIAAAARRPGARLTILAHLTIAAAVLSRPENALLVPFAYLIWRRAPSRREWAAAAATVLPLAALLFHNRADDAASFGGAPSHLLANAWPNLRALLSAHPLACLAGAAALAASRFRSAALATALWFAAFFLVATAHLHGRFDLPSIDRLALPALLAVFAAAGAACALNSPGPARAVLLGALLAAPAWPGFRQRLALAPDDTAKAAWLRELSAFVEPREPVVTFYPPAVVSISGRPAVSARWLLAGGDRPRDLVFFRDFWTTVFTDEARRLEEELRRDYTFREIASREIGGFSYPLYRLTPKTR